jgi:peroxiredoxin family protein
MIDMPPSAAPAPAPPSRPDPGGMTIVAWSGDLDRVWPQLILASTGAAYGMEVTVFFTFWGLFSLVREDVRITGDNWMTKMLSGMNAPGMNRSKLSKLNMGGAGPAMMRKLADRHHVAGPTQLLEVCQEMDVRLLPCQMTMELMGLTSKDLISGVGEPIGAATALSAMQRSSINLFI